MSWLSSTRVALALVRRESSGSQIGTYPIDIIFSGAASSSVGAARSGSVGSALSLL